VRNEKIESVEQFNDRCNNLLNGFKMMNALERNGAVWCCVMAQTLIETFFSSKDPRGAYDEFIEIVNTTFNDYKNDKQKPQEK
jgi:hypothetical protein